MHSDFFKNRFPVREQAIMTDDSPPMSLNEVHMIESQQQEDARLKSSVLGLLSILK